MPRACTVCTHAEMEAIDRALVGGTSLRDIAAQYNVSKTALGRHSTTHLSKALATVREERGVKSAGKVLDRVERLANRLEKMLDDLDEEGKTQSVIQASRELRGSLELLAKLSGELQDKPSTVINVLSSPELARVLSVISDELAEYPEVRARIADRLKALEAAAA